jgi:hypothetical protein
MNAQGEVGTEEQREGEGSWSVSEGQVLSGGQEGVHADQISEEC